MFSFASSIVMFVMPFNALLLDLLEAELAHAADTDNVSLCHGLRGALL